MNAVLNGLRFAVFLLLICCSLSVCAELVTLNQAQSVVTTGDETSPGTVNLPYQWDKRHKGQAGTASFILPLNLPDGPQVPYALYIPRLGNAYEIWLNGALLDQKGSMTEYNGADFAKVPRFIELPVETLQKLNTLQIFIRADIGRRGGLAPITAGPKTEVLSLFKQDNRWRSTGSYVVIAIGLAVGIAALLLFLTQIDSSKTGWQKFDKLYLLVAIAEIFWSIRVADAVIEHPPLSWPWWGLVAVLCMGIWVVSMTLCCIEVAGWSDLPLTKWLRRTLMTALLVCPVAAMTALIYGLPVILTLWYATLLLIFIVFLPPFTLKALKTSDWAYKWLAAAMVLNTLVGIRDLYAFRISDSFAQNTWQRYSSILFGLSLFYAILRKFKNVTMQARTLASELEVRVAQKEQELRESYLQLEKMAREQERLSERSRILRDLHDGVGGHISSAIRQVESGNVDTKEVAQTLRDSLDHLKLSIDAMNLPSGDISTMLANLRYRLEPRLKASGIEMLWDVADLPVNLKLQGSGMRELQFMVFEALSNVLQHAQASQVRMVLQPGPGDEVLLQIIDNGIGFGPDVGLQGRLRSLRERANIIGAKFNVSSSSTGTKVEICL